MISSRLGTFMLDKLQAIKEHKKKLVPILPLAAFSVALLWIYFLQPQTFEAVWKGRSFQLFFVWLIALELILGWENFQASKLGKLTSARTLLFAVSLVLPTLFVVIANYGGGNSFIADLAQQNGVSWY